MRLAWLVVRLRDRCTIGEPVTSMPIHCVLFPDQAVYAIYERSIHAVQQCQLFIASSLLTQRGTRSDFFSIRV
jgi:hypothetical protein